MSLKMNGSMCPQRSTKGKTQMRIKRIELEGDNGHATIERTRASHTIRIDSILRNPKTHEQAWRTWEISSRTDSDELYNIAKILQQRCDGVRGTGGDVQDYYTELQRFAD
jgi:hypothetical protein